MSKNDYLFDFSQSNCLEYKNFFKLKYSFGQFDLYLNKKVIFQKSRDTYFFFFNLKNSKQNLEKKINIFFKQNYKNFVNSLDDSVNVFVYEVKKKVFYFNRDVFGKSLLFYQDKKNFFVVSNKLKNILINKKNSYTFNLNYLGIFSGSHYRYIYSSPSITPIKDIKQLEASNYIKIFFKNKSLIKKIKIRYWFPQKKIFSKDFLDIENLKAEYLKLLKKSNHELLENKKNLCFSLSSGLDSSALVMLNKENKIQTSTVYYDDNKYNEIKKVINFVNKFKLNSNFFKIENKFAQDLIEESCKSSDLPIATSTWVSDYFLKKKISEIGLTNYVSGLGGDQLHCGEYDYFYHFFADLMLSDTDLLKKNIVYWIKNHNDRIFKKSMKPTLALVKLLSNNFLKKNNDLYYDDNRIYRYKNYLNPKFKNYKVAKNKKIYFNSFLSTKSLNEIYFEMLPPCLASDYFNSDKFNIDNYYPYLNKDLVNLFVNLPNKFKINNGVQKILHRKTFKNILPANIVNEKRKKGWNSPAHKWFSTQNNIFENVFNSREFKTRGIYDTEKVIFLYKKHKKIVGHNKPIENHMMFFFQLVSLELWIRSL